MNYTPGIPRVQVQDIFAVLHSRPGRRRCCSWRMYGVAAVVWLLLTLATLPRARGADSGVATGSPPSRIRVAVNAYYPPYLFLDSHGTPIGYIADQWRLFQTHTGIKVDLDPMSGASAERALQSGAVDVIDVIYETPTRAKVYAFSPPHAETEVAVFTDRRVGGVHDLASLQGFTVGTERGGACAGWLRAAGVDVQDTFGSYESLARAAADGNAPLFCMPKGPAMFYLSRYGALKKFTTAFVVRRAPQRFAVRKGNTALLHVIETGMAQITPAQRDTLRRRWLNHASLSPPYRRYVGLSLAGLTALALLAILWIWVLRRTVSRRTRELLAEQHKIRALFDASPDALTVKDRDGAYVECNAAGLSRMHKTLDAVIGHTSSEVFDTETGKIMSRLDAEARRLGRPYTYLTPLTFGDKPERHYEVVKVPLYTRDGVFDGVLSIGRDITHRMQAGRELRLAAVAFESQDPLMVTDRKGVVQRVNGAFTRLTGYAAAEVTGKHAVSFVVERDATEVWTDARESIRRTGYWRGEHWLRSKRGTPRAVRTVISVVKDANGEAVHYICSMLDLSTQKAAMAQIDHMRFFDTLTDLPNRHFLRGELLRLLNTDTPSLSVLLMMGIDHFRHINDLYGRAVGDTLLVMVTRRLQAALGSDATLTRSGGGAFALLVQAKSGFLSGTEELARSAIATVHNALRQPFEAGRDRSESITVGIGWTELVAGHGTPDEACEEAEIAMYAAKVDGRRQVRQFDPTMQSQMRDRIALTQGLRKAVARDELELYFQPLTDASGEVVGAEALLRWRRTDGQVVWPSDFIPVAEKDGLIPSLGHWVLRHACMQLHSWSTRPATRSLMLAINVSALQLAEAGFIDNVRSALAESRIPPGRLTIEITESALLSDLRNIATKLDALHAHGVRISLDDFGTGYSSLTYLSELPLDALKIDPSFVARLPDDRRSAMVARTILAMGHGLGMQVVAEGVETLEQRSFLVARGCDFFQGYPISPPLPAAAFEAWLKQRLERDVTNTI